MTSDETQILMFADWPMSYAKSVWPWTIGKIQEYMYHVDSADRQLKLSNRKYMANPC